MPKKKDVNHITTTTICLCIEYIYTHLALTFIKDFPPCYENDHETYNSPNYGYASILPLPCFLPSLITLTKTHKSEKHTTYPWNTMRWGIPLNYPNMSQIQISTDIPVPQSSARVSENNTEELAPCSPPLHYSQFKGKHGEEQVVAGGFSPRLRCNVWWQLGVIQDVKARSR